MSSKPQNAAAHRMYQGVRHLLDAARPKKSELVGELKMCVLGVGIDIVQVDRIERMLARNDINTLNYLFTPAELKYCLKKKRTANVHFAGRFAAKEAYIKALGRSNGLAWTDIEVVNDSNGRPRLKLSKPANELANLGGVKAHFLSIAHEKDYAIAIVILCGNSEMTFE